MRCPGRGRVWLHAAGCTRRPRSTPRAACVAALEPRSSEVADGLHPAEDLLDPLADSLADGVAGVAASSGRRWRPRRRAGVLRDVRRDAALAAVRDEVARVVALVAAEAWMQAVAPAGARPACSSASRARRARSPRSIWKSTEQAVADSPSVRGPEYESFASLPLPLLERAAPRDRSSTRASR